MVPFKIQLEQLKLTRYSSSSNISHSARVLVELNYNRRTTKYLQIVAHIVNVAVFCYKNAEECNTRWHQRQRQISSALYEVHYEFSFGVG